jgi:hypothetical protein
MRFIGNRGEIRTVPLNVIMRLLFRNVNSDGTIE